LLQVSSVELLEAATKAPLASYSALPAGARWRLCADAAAGGGSSGSSGSSGPQAPPVLRIWLPKDEDGLLGAWRTRPCCGLDVFVHLQQHQARALG
jgi:hypothetical protein